MIRCLKMPSFRRCLILADRMHHQVNQTTRAIQPWFLNLKQLPRNMRLAKSTSITKFQTKRLYSIIYTLVTYFIQICSLRSNASTQLSQEMCEMRLGNRRRQTILLDDESETDEDEPDNRLLVSGSDELFFVNFMTINL